MYRLVGGREPGTSDDSLVDAHAAKDALALLGRRDLDGPGDYVDLRGLFTDFRVEASGFTSLKVVGNYVISAVLALAMAAMRRQRTQFDSETYRLAIAGIVLTILAEIPFTQYKRLWYRESRRPSAEIRFLSVHLHCPHPSRPAAALRDFLQRIV